MSQLEPSSFRDRQARVFYRDGRVLRGLSEEGLRQWRALQGTRFFARAVDEGKMVRTWDVAPDFDRAGWAGVIEHEPVPYVSYPYEWPFGMLREAALLQLELVERALSEGMLPKDATPYNVQWRGTRPLFIDTASFETLAPGDPWVGYRQFCRSFLYPLLLQAYRGVDFQPWLRGRLDGIDVLQCRALLRPRDLLRRGVLTHVWLQAAIDARGGGGGDLRRELRQAGFQRELIAANVRRLAALVRGLTWRAPASRWSNYAATSPYDEAERAAKQAFVRQALERTRPTMVWDLGCNTGEHARLAAEHAETVVAMDSDHLSIERLYHAVGGQSRILPLVNDLTDPSPNLGWRGRERRDLASRGRPDLTLCLALAHHVVLGSNVPLDDFVDWLASLGGDLVIEFVSREDAMVQDLLRNKADVYRDYDRLALEALLRRSYTIAAQLEIGGGRRVLYHARRAAQSGS